MNRRANLVSVASRPGHGPEEETARAELRELMVISRRPPSNYTPLSEHFRKVLDMSKYSEIKGQCGSRKRYADGGRVATKRAGGKTTINIITAPPGAAPAPIPAPPPPPAPPGGPGGMPPAGAAAMQAMGAGGPPAGFKRGGRVGKQLTNASGGAAGGKGRLRKARIAK